MYSIILEETYRLKGPTPGAVTDRKHHNVLTRNRFVGQTHDRRLSDRMTGYLVPPFTDRWHFNRCVLILARTVSMMTIIYDRTDETILFMIA